MVDEKKILDIFSLDGKVAIVTGGAGQLGVKHCEILNKAGATVVSFDVASSDNLDDVAEQIVVDITQLKKVREAVGAVVEKYGRVDILINNAALNPKVDKGAANASQAQFSPYEDYPEELWERDIAVGLTGAEFSTQAVAPYFIKQKDGCIINIASTSSITAPDNRKYEKGKFKSVAYPTVKSALLGLTRAWASYFASVAPGVRVNAVSFGGVNFSMDEKFAKELGKRNMLGRPANPDEYQGIIVFLCSPAASFITASNLVADGGQTAW